MPWLDLQGHDPIVERFRRALAEGRLASTFLFVGPAGVGKWSFAVRLAQALLCGTRDPRLLDPCGQCPGCVQVMAGTHPDFMTVSRPPGKSAIPLGLLKGDDDYPVRESLLFNLSLRPFAGGRKVGLIDDADYLHQEAANCLLKTLEEPPPHSVLILIGTSADRQLPTIRSRAQIVRFRPLDESVVADLLIQRGIATDANEALRLAAFSGGSLSRAVELADPQLWTFRGELLELLSRAPLPGVVLARKIGPFTDEAGKEAAARRARLRLVIQFAVDFFRQLTRQLAGLEVVGDAELKTGVNAATVSGQWNIESSAAAADRSLEALLHIDRNANQSTLIEAWTDDLLQLSRRAALLPV